jgi:hypothetical protein
MVCTSTILPAQTNKLLLATRKSPQIARKINIRRKLNEQPRMDNPETLATLGKQDIG